MRWTYEIGIRDDGLHVVGEDADGDGEEGEWEGEGW